MPKLLPIQITPSGSHGYDVSYQRRLATQLDTGFRDTRLVLNQLADLEALHFVIPGTVSNGTYPIGILPANRTVKALWHGLKAGTCTARVGHGDTGSVVDIEWDGLSPATDVSVTTAIAQEIPASTAEDVTLGTWVEVEVASASGASGLALTVHLA